MSRLKNFNKEEVSVLLSCLEKFPDLISGELGKSFKTNTEIKEAWETVASIISSCGLGIVRNGDQVRKKWTDLKCKTKNKAARLHFEKTVTGGGSAKIAPLTEVEQKVISLIGDTPVVGILPISGDMTAHQILDVPDFQFNRNPLDNYSQCSESSLPLSGTDVEELPEKSYPDITRAGPSGLQGAPVHTSTPVIQKRKRPSSTLRVRKLRKLRREKELRENEDSTANVIKTQNEIKDLLSSIDNRLNENNIVQQQILNTLEKLDSSISTLCNNLTVLSSLAATQLGIQITPNI